MMAEGDEEAALSVLFGAHAMDPDYEAYLKTITDYSLSRLVTEPGRLASTHGTLSQDMQRLAFDHYHAFVETEHAVNLVQQKMAVVDGTVGRLGPHLTGLASSCEKFAQSAQSFVDLRRAHRRTLHNHAQLLELLEIPQLMDTCVKHGCYEEALQLEAFAKKLAKSFPNIKVVADIVSEVEGITKSLLSQLIHQLCTQVQFPVILNAVGYLRRLGIYNELELRVTFLTCRDTWLFNSLSTIPDSNAYTYLNKLIDQSRTHLFDIIHQYKAIFSDDTSSQDDPMKDGGLLYGWISQKIMSFMKTLTSFLPLIEEGAAIGRLLDQCMSYGASLARVGVDVRGLFPPLFEKCIYGLFAATLTSATHHFLENIKSYQFSSTPSSPTTPSKTPKKLEATQPPLILLEHPPLAVLTNAILGAFNELRQCAPLSLQGVLTSRLREALVSVVAAIQSLPNHISFDTNQEKAFAHLCQVVCENFLPYVVHCFHSIYSSVTTHSSLFIDISSLVDSLSRLYNTNLPEPEDEENKDTTSTNTDSNNDTNSDANTDSNTDTNTVTNTPPATQSNTESNLNTNLADSNPTQDTLNKTNTPANSEPEQPNINSNEPTPTVESDFNIDDPGSTDTNTSSQDI